MAFTNIKINNETISRAHCLIQKMNNSYFVKDLNLTEGDTNIGTIFKTLENTKNI